MPPFTFGVANGIIIKGKHRLRAETVRIILRVIGVGVMSPVLCHPIPFVGANEIGTESKEVIDPGTFGGSSVVGIVLNIQSNECLCHTKDNGDGHTTLIPVAVVKECGGSGEFVLHEEEECNVGKGTEEVAGCSEFTSSANDFEHFGFDLPFEGCIKLVPR